ncbi:MAG TPA: S8 family serine peptidase [Longimicrobium sp.]|nr:S8 family serine peptidase [Longimicrobium sp.]
MKRWIAIAACVMTAAACQDVAEPVGPAGQDVLPVHLLGLNPVVKIDPVLTTLLNVTSPLQKLQVLVTYDPTRTTGDAVSRALTSSGAGIIRFKHLPVVFALATPVQIASITTKPGIRSVYSNRQLQYYLAESVPSINGHLAHAAGYDGEGVGIAILDSGIDGAYSPDLKHPTRTVQNVKFIADPTSVVSFGNAPAPLASALLLENVPTSETSSGHGTHVAGIAAGDGTGSAARYVGVAPGANLIGLGTGEVILVLWTLAGLDWILENHETYNIQVVNNSWGSEGTFDPADPINVATKMLYDEGIAVVFAAGNSGPGANTLNPYSAAPWVISVAAACKTVTPDPTNSAAQCADGRGGILADFSSRGIAGDPLYHPDITAPGVNIVSTRSIFGVTMTALSLPADLQDCAIAPAHLPYYICIGGTSMAAPHVAGAIALLEQASGGDLTPDQALAAIRASARPLPGYGEWEVGAGYLDVLAAIDEVD